MGAIQQVLLSGGASLDPETVIWKAAVIAAGGTFESDSVDIADPLVKAIKASTFNSKIVYMMAFLGANLNAARVPLLDRKSKGAATNIGSMVDGDFSQSTGIGGNGSTKRLEIALKPFDLGVSNNAGGYGFWKLTAGTGTWNIGYLFSGAGIWGLALYTDELMFSGDANSAISTGAASTTAHYYGQAISSTTRTLYRNGTSIVTSSVASSQTGITGGNIHVLGLGGSTDANSSRCGVAYLTDGTLTAGEIASLHSILETYLITPTGR